MPTHELSSREMISILQEKFPKFSKIQLSMVRNPEYGVTLSPDARKLLYPSDDQIKCNLARIMAEKQISKYKLSKLSGVNRSTLSRMEQGMDTRISTAFKVSYALGIDITELYN